MSFFKRQEVYSPADLCWIQVTYNNESQSVTIHREGAAPLELCDGSVHQLEELIALLEHVSDTHFPVLREPRDLDGKETLP
jgi:hypothetical protein